MIVLDENIEAYWINLLRKHEHQIISIAESYPGISDREVMQIVEENKELLITEDKDFGELVFAYGFKNVSIIFLRYDQPEYHQIENAFLGCVKKYAASTINKFITISKTKIRVRGI